MKINKKDLIRRLQHDSLTNILKEKVSYPVVSANQAIEVFLYYKEEVIKILQSEEVEIKDEN